MFECPQVYVIALAGILTVIPCQADSINAVMNRLDMPATETLDWSAFGPAFEGITSNSSVTTSSGLFVTVSQPGYSLQVRQENSVGLDGGWNGDFLPGQYLLTNWNSPNPVTISFSMPIFGAGMQIEPGQVQDRRAPFIAFVTAYNGNTVLGQFSTNGTESYAHDNSAPFLGVQSSTATITSLTYRVSVDGQDDLNDHLVSGDSLLRSPSPG